MSDYEDAGYYEIQLNNKQLVFFFMAAVAIAVVVFLCGVMVGRGVHDATIAAAGNNILSGSEPAADADRSVTPAEIRTELDYQKRLESPRADDRLEGASSSPETLVAEAKKAPPAKPPARTAPAAGSSPASGREQASAEPSGGSTTAPRSSNMMGTAEGAFTIQVVALKTEEAALKLVSRLQGKGYRSYLEAADASGLYRVRVGRFASRPEAENVAQQLRDVEKFKPYITQ